MKIENISVGTRIRWSSAAGILTGTVSKIYLGKNAANGLIPWIITKIDTGGSSNFAGTESYLAMLKVETI